MNSQTLLKDNLEEYLPRIRRIVQAIARDEGVVDDITQECCVRIIEKEKLWREKPRKINQWINALTRNLTIDFLKKFPTYILGTIKLRTICYTCRIDA